MPATSGKVSGWPPRRDAVEFNKLFRNSLLPGVHGVVLVDPYGSIDDVHYELSIVPVFPAFFILEIIFDLDLTREDKSLSSSSVRLTSVMAFRMRGVPPEAWAWAWG
jgi:hypothetical protein